MHASNLRTVAGARPTRSNGVAESQATNTTDAATAAHSPYNRAILNAEPVMPNLILADLRSEITANVQTALREDLGSGDITAQLIAAERTASARIITREAATICGTAWVDEVFRQLDPNVSVNWLVQDGQRVTADQTLFTLQGPARALLSGERDRKSVV